MIITIFALTGTIIPVSAKTKNVIVGGEAFGLRLYCHGVMVTGFEKDAESPAKNCGIMPGDIITKVNSQEVNSNEIMYELISKSKGKPMKLSLLRNGSKKNVTLTPMKSENGNYRAGMWIKDSCAGIGTISYYDTAGKAYGALGHGICESDTGGLFANSTGETVIASVTSVNKSENNKIGTLNGYFTSKTIGTIEENTGLGIYGRLKCAVNKNKTIRTAEAEELILGKAEIYTTLYGTKPERYEVRITEICNNNKNSNKNFIIKVTDDKLLSKTGGIVQGMSGSPIVQNGKLVGALTHVMLEDCTEGYCIFAENMIA